MASDRPGRGELTFVWLLALAPLVWWPACLEPYLLPKQTLLDLLLLSLIAVHTLTGSREAGGFLVARSALAAPIGVYLAVRGLACFKAISPADAIDGWFQHAVPMAAALILMVRAPGFDRFAAAAATAGGIAAVIGLAQFAGVSTIAAGLHQAVLPGSVFGNKNMAGEFVLATVPLALYLARRRSFRTAWSAVLLTDLTFLAAAQSKAVWVAAAAILAAGLWWGRREGSWKGPAVAVAISVAIGVVALRYAPVKVVSHPFGYSAHVRLALWANSIPLLAGDPLLGVGPWNWYVHYPAHAFSWRPDPQISRSVWPEAPHNDYLQIACETGVAGLLALLWLGYRLVAAVRVRLASEEREVAFHAALAMASIAIIGCFAYPLHQAAGLTYFWVLASFAARGAERPVAVPGGMLAALAVLLVAFGGAARSVSTFTADVLHKQAILDTAQGNGAQAERSLRDSIETDGLRAHARWRLAAVLAARGKRQEAIGEYRRSLELNPNRVAVLCELSELLWRAGDARGALPLVSRALAILPSLPEALVLQGRLHLALGNSTGAIESFSKALDADSRCVDAALELGDLHLRAGDKGRAEKYLERAVESGSSMPSAHNNLGALRLERGDFAGAVRCFQDAVRLAPDQPASYFNLGQALRGAARNAEAVAAFEQFLTRWKGDERMRQAALAEIRKLGG